MTVYTTTEGMGSVTLCAIITTPASGVAPRPFTIAATTSDGTARKDCINLTVSVIHSQITFL